MPTTTRTLNFRVAARDKPRRRRRREHGGHARERHERSGAVPCHFHNSGGTFSNATTVTGT